MTFSTYMFGVDGMLKIGHCRDIEGRMYQLMWNQRPAYVQCRAGEGELLARHDFETKIEASTAERYCHMKLHDKRVQQNARGGRCEWFNVDIDTARDVFKSACAAPMISFPLSTYEKSLMCKATGEATPEAAVTLLLAQYIERHQRP